MNSISTTSKPARIAVVDDHGIVRFGYAQLINQHPQLEVCGMACSEQEGLEMLRRETPDVAIIDLSLSEGDGMDLIKSVVALFPATKVLVISAHPESLFASRVLAFGALGYINKQKAPEQLIDGIQTVLRGDFYFSEEVTKNLIRSRIGAQRSVAPDGIASLTNRELQVYEFIGHGQTTRQIADAMFLSVKTIERHKENIKQKFGLENATQLVQHATKWVLGRGY